MHFSKTYTVAAAICLSSVVLFSCKKDLASSTVQNTTTDQDGVAVAAAGGVDSVYLQPGPTIGQDAFVDEETGDGTAADKNYGQLGEIDVAAWRKQGSIAHIRTYIKFAKLDSVVPAGATILAAKLRLYGLDPNTSVVFPNGNSVYPGSPYDSAYPDNSCYILRVTGHDWNEKTITWNNKPGVSKAEGDTIPTSTSQWNYDVTADVTNLVKNMVGTGKKNYGFCIVQNTEKIYRAVLFSSSEAEKKSKWPVLVIKYKP